MDLTTAKETDEADSLTVRMRRTMSTFAAAWTAGDIDGLMALFGDEPVYHTSSGRRFQGRTELRAGLVEMCQPAPDGTTHAPPPLPPMVFFRDTCLSYWTLTLTSDNVPRSVCGVDVITFDDAGRVTKKDAYRKLI